MHVVELRIAGFKSFVDPLRLAIEAGLTGVVGPNGCGKSNLLEAVRWGMGATSAKAMRADDMDDVIFAGSGARPAREHAEVTLVVDLGPEQGVREVSRRIRRGAGSAYKLNGREARAKDVQLLFADASSGANSPALVRQGQISELIAARPENRRRILEEAAGVAGLHARRHDADLKLAAASANLERLGEVAAEIEGQRASLKRQARLAERYRNLAAEIRNLEALTLHRKAIDAEAALDACAAQARAADRAAAEATAAASMAARTAETARESSAPLREEELIAGAVLRRLEGERVGLERDLADAKTVVARIEAALVRVVAEQEREARLVEDADCAVARLDSESVGRGGENFNKLIASAEARAAAGREEQRQADAALDSVLAAAAQARAERSGREAELRAARTARERAEGRVAALARETSPDTEALARRAEDARERALTLETAAEAAKATLAAAERALRDAETALGPAHSAHGAARRRQDELAAEIRALAAVEKGGAVGAYKSVLTEIEVEPGFEAALAAALGADLEAGLDEGAPRRWAGAEVRDFDWPPDLTPLADKVKAPPEIAARLAASAIVPPGVDGARLQRNLPPGARLVSIEGAVWRWDGFRVRAGAPSAAAIRLEQRNRLAALERERGAAEAATNEAERRLKASQAVRDDADAQVRKARAAAPIALSDALKAAAARDGALAEAARAEERKSELAAQRFAATSEAEAARASEAAVIAAVAALPPVDDSAIAQARRGAEAARATAAEAAAELAALRRSEAQFEARRAAISRERAEWLERKARSEARLQELAAEAARETEALAAARLALPRAEGALSAFLDGVRRAEARQATARDALAVAERAAREAEQGARETEAAAAEAGAAKAAAEARLEAARERLTALATQAADAMQCDLTGLAARAGVLLSQAISRAPLAEIEKRIDRLRTERDQGGPVNLRAEEELEEVDARLATLASERSDVEAAIAKLRQAIGRLNGEARRRLLAAHAAVDKHFADLFATLFEGGRAELRLTEAEDPLACGLDIFAEPPGKRLSALSLMSGGEQALTATALIFAVFLANPAPICVLDEVDAPLDDANVDRFCRLLEEMKKRTDTRFLVITHNPVTMSRMDRLLGVTMPERGVSQVVSVDLQRATELAAE